MAGTPRRRRPCLQRAAGLSCCSRLVRVLLATVLTSALLASGCQAPATRPGPSPTASAAPASQQVMAAQQVMAGVAAAVLDGDHDAYDGLLADTDPAFTTRATWLWTNLSRLPLTGLGFTVSAQPSTSAPEVAHTLGDHAMVASATLTWRLRGRTRDASTTVRLAFTGSGSGLRWAGVLDSPAQTVVPLWWTGPVDVAGPSSGAAHPAIVVRAQGAAAPSDGSWAILAQQAVGHAAAHAPAGTSRAEPVVIEVPADARGFARATGRTDDPASLAAVTLAMGVDQRTAPAVIVVSPEAGNTTGPAFVLTHEAVHALWRSPATAAPMWLEEGFADTVAAAAYPDTTSADDRRLRAEVSAHGAPKAFPADTAFRPDAADLDTTYALARSICTFIVDQWGWSAMTSIMTRVGANPASPWWTIVGASSRTDVERQWSAWLSRSAGR